MSTKALRARTADIIVVDFQPFTKGRKTRWQRFWEKVDRSAGPDACWPWTASIAQGQGYGKFGDAGRTRAAHRVAHELSTGEVLSTETKLRHVCNNKLCCNPRHIIPGTQQENIQDAVRAGVIGQRKLNTAKVIQIVALIRAGNTQLCVAKQFQITAQHVQHIMAGRSWSRVTGIARREPQRRAA